ncbi:MAG: ABC transporter ATP-binding protein [Bdellovibrionota bacterium]
MKPLLEVQNLSVQFDTLRGKLPAVQQLSFSVTEGEVLGIVGESGSGKSVANLALMGLLPKSSHVSADTLRFQDFDLLRLSSKQRRSVRGGLISMIFQDPMSSLNPCYRVGSQIEESINIHQPEVDSSHRRQHVEQLLQAVGIVDVERVYRSYPHELSGGMCQRVMIAMAIACNPKLIIADEPTTALDVTIQAQILELLAKLNREKKMSMILVTHDIGVVVEHADRIMVMYAGQAVETGKVDEVISHPQHPYTQALLHALPGYHSEREHRTPLPSLAGLVPDLIHRPQGCLLSPRCPFVQDRCKSEEPSIEIVSGRVCRCFYPLGSSGDPS